jgi:hypothetical protein
VNAVATVTALPGTRLATIPDLDPSRRMVLLAGLATEVIDRQREGREPLPDTFVTLLLRGLCPDGMTPEAQAEGFAEYVDAVLLEQDCESGWVHWTQIEPGLTCEGRQEAAREIARGWAAGALLALVHGTYDNGGN